MLLVFCVIIGIIWGIGSLFGKSIDNKYSSIAGIIAVDLILLWLGVTGGKELFIFFLVLAIILDILIIDSIEKVNSPEEIKKMKKQIDEQNKYDNDYGITYNNK